MDYSQIRRSLTPLHASLHHERVSHRPFGAPDRHRAFTPERVGIESDDGSLTQPFPFAMPGFRVTELWPRQEGARQWRRMMVPRAVLQESETLQHNDSRVVIRSRMRGRRRGFF
jgi:hypothetical protein